MTLAGFVALIAPCGGRSGLPKLCACACAAAAAREPAAVAPKRPRRDMGFIGFSAGCDQRMFVHPTCADFVDIVVMGRYCRKGSALTSGLRSPTKPAWWTPALPMT